MKTKFISTLMLLALALMTLQGVFTGAAFAADSTPNIADTYTIDGLTYYNVNSQNFNSDKKFYVDVFSTPHSAMGNLSLGDLWLMAAVGIEDEWVSLWVELFRRSYYKNVVDIGEVVKQALLSGKHTNDSTYTYSAPRWNNSNGGYVETSVMLKPKLKNINNETINFDTKYIVRFSDFTVGALLPADQGLYVSTVEENGSMINIEASPVKNDTNGTATGTQNISRTVSESITSTVNHSNSYSFTEGLKIAAEASVLGLSKMSSEFSSQFQQAFSDGWTKSEGKINTKTTGSSVSVVLPPYTNVLIKQGTSKTTVTTKYNCPVIIGYKVTVTLELLGEGAKQTRYTFGSSNSNARKDLNHRALDEGSKNLDEQSIDWENILKDNDFKNAIQKIAKNVPMSGSGATIAYTNNTTYSEVAGKAAIYPLSYVELGKSNVPFIDNNNTAAMKIGNYSYAEYLTIIGYNAYGAEYYGFDKRKGHWVIVDENMRELSAENSPVVLEKEAATGLTKYRAVKPGTCYLKYIIDENAYPTAIGADTFTKNSELSKTAMLPITVIEEEVTYEINGSYIGMVNTQSDNLEGEGKLEVRVYDKTGKEIAAPYLWDARELNGISLQTDGTVSFTKAGNYNVRVTNSTKSMYSDWKQITAKAALGDDEEPDEDIPLTDVADEYTMFIISGNYIGGVSNDKESIEGVSKLQVTIFDSTGKELAVPYTWEAKEGSEGMTLEENGDVSFTQTGSYYVRVKSGEYYSDWVEITVNEKAPARFTHIPTPARNTYTGESLDLLAGDAECEGGSVVYSIGEDSSTAPLEYNSDNPTATEVGTYYVWCKVIGDVNHDNSEPLCIVASIEEKVPVPYEDTTEKLDDEGNTLNSSGSGCDTGISALGLGILFVASVIRKKTR